MNSRTLNSQPRALWGGGQFQTFPVSMPPLFPESVAKCSPRRTPTRRPRGAHEAPTRCPRGDREVTARHARGVEELLHLSSGKVWQERKIGRALQPTYPNGMFSISGQVFGVFLNPPRNRGNMYFQPPKVVPENPTYRVFVLNRADSAFHAVCA